MITTKQLSVLVAKNIKRIRLEKKMTQEGAAEKAKMHYKFYQRLESQTGRNKASMPTIAHLATAFKVHPSEFYKPIRKRS